MSVPSYTYLFTTVVGLTIVSSSTFIIEDFVKLKPFTAQEISDLEIVVACPYVPSREE